MTTYVYWAIFVALMVAIVLLLALVFGWGWWLGSRAKAQTKKRGFEVNLLDGKAKSLKERETDHG